DPGQRGELAKHLVLADGTLGAREQLGMGDEGHAQAVFGRQAVHMLGNLGRTVLDQMDQDVGVEHVVHSDSRSWGGAWVRRSSSSARTKSGSKLARTCSNASPRRSLAGCGRRMRSPS